MPYDIRFNVQQTGAETIDQVAAKMAVLKTQVTATSSAMAASAKSVVDAQQGMVAAMAAGNTELATQAAAEAAKHRAALESIIAKQNELKSSMASLTPAVEALGTAHAQMVPQVAAASAAIREFEGALPIRAVERFAVNVLGLGPLLQKVFPVVGVLAFAQIFGEVVEKVYKAADNFFYLRDAMKAVQDTAKSMASETENAIDTVNRLAVQTLRDQGKPVQAAQLERRQMDSRPIHPPQLDKDKISGLTDDQQSGLLDAQSEVTPAGVAARLTEIKKKMTDLQGEINTIDAGGTDPTGLNTHFRSQASTALSAYQDLQQYLEGQQSKAAAEGAKGDADVAKEADAEAKRATDRKKEQNRAVRSVAKHGEEIAQQRTEAQKREDERTEKTLDLVPPDIMAGYPESQVKLANLQTAGALETNIGGLNQTRAEIQRNAGLGSGSKGSDSSVATRISEASQLRDIDQQETDERVKAETEILERLKSLGDDHVDEVEAQKNKIIKIQQDGDQKIYEDQTKYLDLIHDQQTKQQDEIAKELDKQVQDFRSLVGGLFDAVTSRTPNAITNFAKSKVLGIGQTMAENAAQSYILPTLQKLQPSLPGPLGSLFGGTGLTKSAASDPIKLSNDANTAATDANTIELKNIRALATSPSGGGGGMPSGAGMAASAPFGALSVDDSGNPTGSAPTSPAAIAAAGATAMAAVPKVMSALSSTIAQFGTGASSFLSGNGLLTLLGDNPRDAAGIATSQTTLASQIGAGVGLTAAAGTAAYGIYSGLKQGGVGGDLKAAGSAVGLAGGIVGNIAKLMGAASPLLSAIPVIGSLAAIALPLIGGLFNGPQQRANAINTALGQATYNAPQALNVTQSSNGTFADFDARGNLRTSSFSAVPTVREGSTWEQTHGLFGGPPTFYNVPGGQTSQFGAPVAPTTVINHNYAPGAIQTIDAPSFEGLLKRSTNAVGNAAAAAMQNGHGALTAEVQRAAG